jgi:Ca-activated chloride channel family protein
MYQLEEKIYFYLLALIPVIWLLFTWFMLWRKRAQDSFANKTLLDKLSPEKSTFKPILKTIMLSLALLFLIIGLVNPKMGTKLASVKREGVDIVFAVDVSKSMLAEDVAPNRMEKSKQLMSKVIDELGGDRVGIIAYAASAVPVLPITNDFAAAKMFLKGVNTDLLSSQGTAISQALEMAKGYYDDEEQANKILIILSDGEDHSEDVLTAAKAAAKEGIKVFTIGIGTEKGERIPIKQNGRIYGYKQDNQGNTVITKRNDKVLKEIAKVTNAKYIDGNKTQYVVDFLKEVLGKMDKSSFETKQYADYKDQFQWFLGLGLLFLLIDIFLLEKKTNWIEKLNLFR